MPELAAAYHLDPQGLTSAAVYKLMIGCVVPRPIAWVSTVDAAGVRNVAPFSSFMAVSSEPPTIAFSAGPRGADLGVASGCGIGSSGG